jgi:hypothetical protein
MAPIALVAGLIDRRIPLVLGGLVLLNLISSAIHRAYMHRVRSGKESGRLLSFLERFRAYTANEEFLEVTTGRVVGHH